MKIAVTGSSGLVGNELVDALARDGHSITRVVRGGARVRRPDRVTWDPRAGTIDAGGLEDHDVVIHLAGESLFGLWTPARKDRIRRSRVQGTQLLASTLAGLDRPPKLLISASAVGFYGDRPDARELDESDPSGEGFLAGVVRGWESATEPAEVGGIRVVRLRFGLVLSPRGGIVGTMLPFFRFGLGSVVGPGDQMWSWIALPELPHVVRHVMQNAAVTGSVNAVAPEPVSARTFSRTLAAVLDRPAFIHVPALLTRLAPGGMGQELALSSAPVVPRRLLESGYDFRYPALRDALEGVLGREPQDD